MSRILSTGGGVSRPRPGGGGCGVWPGGRLGCLVRGCPGPQPGGSPGPLQGAGDLQAHTWGDVQAHTGGVSRPKCKGCIPACTEADPHSQQTATTVGGTHPTGMHSCLIIISSIPQFLVLRIETVLNSFETFHLKMSVSAV